MSADPTPNPLPATQPTATAQAPTTTPPAATGTAAPAAAPAATPAPPPNWQPLTQIERRILGVLIEKQKTSKTADSYPLTLNSLLTGCNQKSNRDPVMELDEVEIEEGLNTLQKKTLVARITGGRVERFKHNLYDMWTRNGPELAVLAELLLRGPQTRGDLRGRAGRMDPIETLDGLEAILKSLNTRRLVVYLTDPDRRGALVTHGFHPPEELALLKSNPGSVADTPPPRASSPDAVAALEAKLSAAVEEIEALKARVGALEAVTKLPTETP